MFNADFLANIIVWRWISNFIIHVIFGICMAILVAVLEWQEGHRWVAVVVGLALYLLAGALRNAWQYGNRDYQEPEAARTEAHDYDYNYDVRKEYAPGPLAGLRAEPGARYRSSR